MAASIRKQRITLAILLLLRIRRRRRVNRQVWTRSWIQRREKQGVFCNLIQELRTEDSQMYRRYFRVDEEGFNIILGKVKTSIQKNDTYMRLSVSPTERLALTLRYLATGETFHSLSYAYRIGERTISGIVMETCEAIYNNLKDEYVKVPNTPQEWETISKEFKDKWNYPFCLGAIDGKHIAIRQPAKSGSEYFNYKHFFSVLLLALVDANYKFIFIDVGATGRSGDAGIFAKSDLKVTLDDNSLGVPEPAELHNFGVKCNYHIIGDDAFPLRKDVMKPFPHRNLNKEERIFNYRFSRARRVVENAFGILSNRFRVFLTTIPLEPDFVEKIVLAACCLHNFMIDHQSTYVQPTLIDQENDNHDVTPGTWRQNVLSDVEPTRNRNFTASAKFQRQMLQLYFNSNAGRVSWQDQMI